MKPESSEKRRPVTLLLGDHARRELVERAAERAIAQGRPVSVAEIARDVVALGLAAPRSGEAS